MVARAIIGWEHLAAELLFQGQVAALLPAYTAQYWARMGQKAAQQGLFAGLVDTGRPVLMAPRAVQP